ncbi:hypothetical protein E2C01_097643 [Portunus trituberculatus]|uniref:Uncharacterized protein n=1 Tax=Portunus trituberculatus TaxID=210409 RepID=A0A5B7KBX5_PORTR|nr:hypothetical protein [Portunus trituberculatus]
MTILQEREGTK